MSKKTRIEEIKEAMEDAIPRLNDKSYHKRAAFFLNVNDIKIVVFTLDKQIPKKLKAVGAEWG